MPTLTITWHTVGDDRVCPVCQALDGYTWVFVAGKDFMTDALWHPRFGIVWSLAEGSNAHGRGYLTQHGLNCRCRIEPHFDLEDVYAKCVYLAEIVKSAADGNE